MAIALVGINPGTGANIYADSVNMGLGSAYVQYLKLVDGTAGGTNVVGVTAAGAMRTYDMGAHTSGKTYSLAANATTGVKVEAGGAPLANRVGLLIQNNSDVAIEWSFASSTALGEGVLIPSGQSVSLRFGATLAVYVKSVSGTGKNVRVAEVA